MNIKRIMALLLAVLMMCTSFASCVNNKAPSSSTDPSVSTPEGTTPSTTTPPEVLTQEEKTGIYTWLSSAYVKNIDGADIPRNRSTEGIVSMAKNETEGIQVSFFSENRLNGASFEIKNEYEGIKVELFREHTISANNKNYPDPLAPSDGTVRISKNETRTLMINFTTDQSTKAGVYEYEATLKSNKNEVLHTYTISVVVYEVTYPETPTLDTAVGLGLRAIAYQYGLTNDPSIDAPEENEEAAREILVKYYEYMIDHKVTPIELPYDILDERADKYMSDPRVTSFCVPSSVDDDTLAAIYAKLKSNPEWLAKAYIYPVDEPTNTAHIDQMIAQAKRFERICPDIRMATSFFVNVQYNNEKDQLEVMGEILDIFCCKPSNWNRHQLGWGFGIADHPKLGTFADRMYGYQAEGKELWSYVCWEPRDPYTNLLLNERGLNHRILFWQQYNLGTTGFLYWSANWWDYVRDPWLTTKFWLDASVHGDGILLYPGNKIGVDGPVGSIRFEALRDGVEDYELLTIAESLLGEAWVKEQIKKVSTSLTTYTTSEELFESVRVEIFKAVTAENNK
jgi:hypothetical protein